MNIENPTTKLGGSLERKKKALGAIIESRIKWHIDKAIEENSGASVDSKIYLKGLAEFVKVAKQVVSEKETELSGLYDSIAALSFKNRKEFAQTTKEKVVQFMLDNFGFDEIENLSRQGKQMLNRLIEYQIHGDEVSIHVPVTFLENFSELRLLFIDALKKLADKLKNDPEFKSVQKISARSWIVLKSHKVLEKNFGFTILSLDPENNEGSAEISREKLIELYGE